jgi:hypothetical protein
MTVRMISPVDSYSLVSRALKYGIQFLALAFMAVFCLELVSGRCVHPVQYLFTGIALVFFYVLLLSLSEHLGFPLAYLAASVATGLMLAIYVGAAFVSVLKGLVMAMVFAATYGILYLILQLEDYALLAGAILGFVALTIVGPHAPPSPGLANGGPRRSCGETEEGWRPLRAVAAFCVPLPTVSDPEGLTPPTRGGRDSSGRGRG